MNKEHYVLTIKAEDRPALLHLITGVVNKKLVPLISLTAAPTDIHDIILITMEIEISERALSPLILKLENIIEVFAIDAVQYNSAISQRSAYFRMSKEILATSQAEAINKYGAQIVMLDSHVVLISKSGSDAVIRQLYDALEGRHLMGFSQTGIIVDNGLIGHEDTERISGLAA